MRQAVLCLVLALAAGRAFGQTAFRTELLRFQGHFEGHPAELFFGYGVDRQVSPRTSFGITLNAAWSSIFSSVGSTEEVRWRQYDITYTPKRALVNLDFRSDFAFSDIDEFHAFMGTTAAVSWVRASAATSSASGQNYDYYSVAELGLRDRYTASALLFPVGLRGGIRGGLEGAYMELYAGFGMNLGPSVVALGAPYLGKGVPLAPTFLQFGLAFGVGG